MRVTAKNLRFLQGKDKILMFSQMPEVIFGLAQAGLKVVLVQGVYDIVHRGHIEYFRAGKALDPARTVLVAALENDETVRRNKGVLRPINPLSDRLQVVSEFMSVGLCFGYDDVPNYNNPRDYIARWRELGPAVILAAAWDPHIELKRWQAKKSGTEIAAVNYRHINSTTRMLKMVGYED